MELMTTCLDKLIKRLKGPIPEYILGKMAVAVSIPSPPPRKIHSSQPIHDLYANDYVVCL